jgi:hypothetical protein
MRHGWIVLAGLAGAGCDTLECGPGTHRSGDECVPNVQVACGEGTVFADGRCMAPLVPDGGLAPADGGLTCGPGTVRRGDQCVPSGGPRPDAGSGEDADVDRDAGPDTDAVAADAGADGAIADALAPDMAPPPPTCPAGRVAGQPPANCGALPPGGYCVVGVARELVNNCALPTDAHLAILLIDPIAAAAGQPFPAYVRGQGAVGEGGAFAIVGQGDASALALIVDEAMEPDVWARSVSGVTAEGALPGEVYRATAFATTLETEGRWAQALDMEPGALQQTGFLVGRVLSPALAPVAGATVGARRVGDLAECAAGQSCLRFFDDDPRLTGFRPAGTTTTGQSGAFLVIRDGAGAYQDRFFVSGTEATYGEITAGANPGSGFHIAFVPQP